MKIRYITSLAFRLLAVYIGSVAIQYISLTARMLTPAMRNANVPTRMMPWPNYAVPAALYVIGGALLFWYSIRLSPKTVDDDEGALDFQQLKSVLLTVVGAFFLINYGPLAIADLLAQVSDWFRREPPLDRWINDVGCSVGGLFLIVVNAPKRETVPGFDEMRSDMRRY